MRIQVKLFAGLKQRLGCESLILDLPDDAVAGAVRDALVQRCPDAEPLLRRALLACQLEYVADSQPLREGLEVACIPPVSGG